jgi:hypothetical protein
MREDGRDDSLTVPRDAQGRSGHQELLLGVNINAIGEEIEKKVVYESSWPALPSQESFASYDVHTARVKQRISAQGEDVLSISRRACIDSL